MRRKLTVIYSNGYVLVMPYMHFFDRETYLSKHPEIICMYESYANFKGFVYRKV